MKLQLEILGDKKMRQGVGAPDTMEIMVGDETMEEDNTIETNGSESGEANGLSVNGEDSNDSFTNQLSIDTGDINVDNPVNNTTNNKPTIRIAKGLHKSPEQKTELAHVTIKQQQKEGQTNKMKTPNKQKNKEKKQTKKHGKTKNKKTKRTHTHIKNKKHKNKNNHTNKTKQYI